MDKKTKAIVVLASLLISETGIFLWAYGPFIIIRPVFNMRNLQKSYSLTNDVVILGWRNEPCGYLRRGTVIHTPCIHDLGETGHGDIDFLKIYVRVENEAWRSAVGNIDDLKSEKLAGLRLYPATNWSPFANKTSKHVNNWGAVTNKMTRERVHALLGEPSASLTRQQWDLTVRRPDNSLTIKGALVLSLSPLCEFATVEIWADPKDQNSDLSVYYSKTDKVMGRRPYIIEDKRKGQPTPGSDHL